MTHSWFTTDKQSICICTSSSYRTEFFANIVQIQKLHCGNFESMNCKLIFFFKTSCADSFKWSDWYFILIFSYEYKLETKGNNFIWQCGFFYLTCKSFHKIFSVQNFQYSVLIIVFSLSKSLKKDWTT